ncbi:caspase family protein [Mucilaginibacter sp. KACC 22063]|uniref:caspase family protein n=1 Tax=Mucilaginibacter sp. KACC 22063 TaxID=3025666 RepID=UPI0023663188|nr:caspase family protein [Mucilaginibacter sp. KACC 22063]WDF57211.1 caspase family protein [Mucilaginibacter sp. KACC 22063]
MDLIPIRIFLIFSLFCAFGKSMAQELVIQRGDQELLGNYRFDEKEERMFSWGVNGHSVRMWNAANGRLADEFYMDNAGMIMSVAFSDSTGRLACVNLGTALQVWDVSTRESVSVPLTFGDMYVQVRGSQFLVFSAFQVKLFDARNMHLIQTIPIRKATPGAMVGSIRDIYTYRNGYVIVATDSVGVYDENWVCHQRWPTAIGGSNTFVNPLAFDERRHALVLYDMNQHDFALLDVDKGTLSYKKNLGVLSGASFCGDYMLLLESVGGSPMLMDLRNGKLTNPDALLPQGSGFRKLYANDRWLVCSQRLSIFGSTEKGRVLAFIDPNTLLVKFQDTVATDLIDTYAAALGRRHFAYSTVETSTIGQISHSPRIYDLQYFNLTDPVSPALNTLSTVYERQLLRPDGTLNQKLQVDIFKNFNRQNEISGVVFSPQYRYAFYNAFGDKFLKKRNGDSLMLVKNLGWNNQLVGMAAFTPDERYLLVKRDSAVDLVRTADGSVVLPSHKLEHQIFTGSLLCDNDYAWVIGDPFKVDLLDLKKLNWDSLKFPWGVSSMARIDALNYMACTSNGIYTVNVSTREIKPLLNNHRALMIASDPPGQKLYALMDDGSVRIIDLKEKGITSLSDGSSAADLSVHFNEQGPGNIIFQHFFLSDDRHYLVTHTRDNKIKVWDLIAGKVAFRKQLAGVNILMLDSKKHLLIALTQTSFGLSQDDVWVFDLLSGETVFSSTDEVRKLQLHPPASISDLVTSSISVSGQNNTKEMSRFTFKQIRLDPDFHYLWMTSGQMLGVLDLRKPALMKWSRSAKEFSIDGFRDSLAMVRATEWSGFVNPVTRDTMRIPFGPPDYIPASGHFPGYSYAIMQRYDKGVLYDFKLYSDSASRLLVSHRMATEIVQVSASRDGKYVATCTDYEHTYRDTAFLFDAASGKQITALAGPYYRTFFTADNRYWLCLQNGHPAGVYDIANKTWKMIDMDGLNVEPMTEGHWVKSDGRLVDPENAKVYQTNLVVITEVSKGEAYGYTLSGEMGTYQLATNTFHNFSFQQTGGFAQALVSPDKRYLISLGADGFVSKWDLQSGLIANQAPVDYDPLRTIYFNTDSTFVVTINAYKAVSYSLKSLHQKYTFAPGNNGTLNFFLSDGSYFADRSDLNRFYFNYKGGLFGYTQFDMYFNRPDKVLAAADERDTKLIRAYQEAALKRRGNTLVPSFDLTKFHAPEIRVLNERLLPTRQSADTVSVIVQAEDTSLRLTELRVNINGNPVSANGLVRSADGKKMAGRLLLHLGAGHNRIELSCVNENGVASLVRTVEINCAAARPAPKTYFVGIGLNHYQSPQLQTLHFSVKDVHLVDTLLHLGGAVHTAILFESQVTPAAIDSLLKTLSATDIDDKVVIYFSGHGIGATSGFYLSTYSAEPAAPANTAYDFVRMEKLLAAIPARQKLVLIDACNSGQSDRTLLKGDRYAALDTSAYALPFDLMQDVFADVSSATGAVVVCASRSTQYANEGKTNGVFTECLSRGIREKAADSNGDGDISVEELKNYLLTQVPKSTNKSQHPVTRGDIPGLDWLLLKLP